MGQYVHTLVVHVCKKCDKGVDALDVPDEPCGHDRETHVEVRSINLVPQRDYDRLLALYRGACEEAMELLKDAPGAAAMFDPDYGLIQAGLYD